MNLAQSSKGASYLNDRLINTTPNLLVSTKFRKFQICESSDTAPFQRKFLAYSYSLDCSASLTMDDSIINILVARAHQPNPRRASGSATNTSFKARTTRSVLARTKSVPQQTPRSSAGAEEAHSHIDRYMTRLRCVNGQLDTDASLSESPKCLDMCLFTQ